MKCSLLDDYHLIRTFVSSGTEKYRAKVTPNNHAGVRVVENQEEIDIIFFEQELSVKRSSRFKSPLNR